MKRHTILLAALVVAHGTAWAQTKPPAQYWMSVETQNMTIPGMDPQAAGMAGMMGAFGMGGPAGIGGPQRNLRLQLVAPGTAAPPQAQHDIPPGQKMGEFLPLTTPAGAPRGGARDETGDYVPPEKPRGRMLIYWGCGETVRAGQPRVIDVGRISSQEYAGAFRTRPVPRQSPPAPRAGWTYGDWPNEEKQIRVPADSSLVGNHTVRGNYPPEIRFGLDSRRDFMDPVVFTQASGSLADTIGLEWRAIPTATGYLLAAAGSQPRSGDIVFWSSSETQEPAQNFMDYLPPAFVQQLVRDKVALAPDVTRCAIPRGIFKDTDAASLQFIAYGDELNLADPPRPADPKAQWNPIWLVKVRLKSTGMLPLTNEMGERAARPGSRSRSGTERAQEAPSGEAATPPADKPTRGTDAVEEGVRTLKGLFGF